MKFKVGQRVKIIENMWYKNKIGRIIEITPDSLWPIKIQFYADKKEFNKLFTKEMLELLPINCPEYLNNE